jgi:negative regulator of sigma-B (phosphoserine phosphatase)
MILDIGTVNRCAEGEHVSGDAFTIDQHDGGVLISVVDGLGHGPHAATAASAFAELVAEDTTLELEKMMAAANERLARTRGAAAALLRISTATGRIDFVGVGNIHLHTITPERVHPVCVPGIVGHRLRKIVPFGFDLPEWGIFALCSDGLSSRIDLAEFESLGAQAMAEALLEHHGKVYDDATCVVIRYTHDAG